MEIIMRIPCMQPICIVEEDELPAFNVFIYLVLVGCKSVD
ncbi:hypothetical protein X975_20259, partial [Stegodyphus mimosarum]